jgi:3'-phosphoadenosine 5'-phosphosulfate sulfotransferase (PAPS reductase)/FAD synthetase
MIDFTNIIDRHHRIALQVSGGRDSIACLYLMRPFWDKMTVYWCDTGDAYPETRKLVTKIMDMVPNFAVISGNQPSVIDMHGMPSDIVPVSATPMGLAMSGLDSPKIQDRYSCCFRTMMAPTQDRMRHDGITLIIRGQKSKDRFKGQLKSGDVIGGVEYLFPIEAWDARQVMEYLRREGAPIPRFYEMLETMPDCMSCTAWWEEGISSYLKRYHFDQYLINQKNLGIINTAVGAHIAAFNKEVA